MFSRTKCHFHIERDIPSGTKKDISKTLDLGAHSHKSLKTFPENLEKSISCGVAVFTGHQ